MGIMIDNSDLMTIIELLEYVDVSINRVLYYRTFHNIEPISLVFKLNASAKLAGSDKSEDRSVPLCLGF